MLVIRFFRTGKKNQPFFKIVVTDKRKAPRGGRFIDEVGFWDPIIKKNNLKKDKIKEWILKGAKPSSTVYNLLLREKVIEGKKIDVHKKAKGGAKDIKETKDIKVAEATKEVKATEVAKEAKDAKVIEAPKEIKEIKTTEVVKETKEEVKKEEPKIEQKQEQLKKDTVS